MIFHELLFNVILLLCLGFIYGLLIRRWSPGEKSVRILSGCLFGAIAVIGMIFPFRYSTGIFFDGRSIVICMAGLFGGPLTASVAALLAAGYRLSQGGAGSLTGVGVIITSALMGTAYYYLRLKRPRTLNPLGLLGLGFLVHFVMLLWMLTLPGDMPFKILNRITLPVLLIFPGATLLLGLLLRDQEVGLKTAEEARRLSRIVENTPLAIALTDLQGKVEYVNPGLLTISGFSSEKEIIGRTIFSFTDQAGEKRLRDDVIPTLLSGRKWQGEMEILRSNGSFFSSELCSSLLRDQAGNPEYLLGTFLDITARKQADKSLAESERRYQRLVESASSYIFTIFLEYGHPVRAVYSPTCLALTGYTAGELEENTDLWHKIVLKEDHAIIEEQFSLLLAGDIPGVTEYRIRRKDGEIRWFSATLSPNYNDSGKLGSYDGLIRDITDRKLVEEALKEHRENLQETITKRTLEMETRVKQADKLNRGMVNLMEDSREVYLQLENTSQALEEANTELESFAYSAAHDLKAPLRAIEGYSQAVLDDFGHRLDEEGRNYVNRITGVCHRMAGLIDDLLAYSHLSQREIRVKPIELAPLIDKALENLENRIKESSGMVEVDAPLPMVRANRSILLQLVENLISNALTFVAPGVEPKVKIWTHLEDGMVRLCVDDNGIGIGEEDRGRIFQVFERLHGIETYPGTGIGLAIVRRGVEKMGGRVGLESESGKGSTFWIELPEGTMKDKGEGGRKD